MNLTKLCFKNFNKKLILSLLAFTVAGAAMFFSLFYTSAIENKVANEINLNKDEYYSYVNESRISGNKINYYECLKEEFEQVVPFVETEILINSELYNVLGTDIDQKKLKLKNSFFDYEIEEEPTSSTTRSKVYLHQSLKSKPIVNEILDKLDFDLGGWFKLSNQTIEEIDHTMILSLSDYAISIDNKIIHSESGIVKYVIQSYFIKSSIGEKNLLDSVNRIYGTSEGEYFIDTYTKLFNQTMEKYLIFSSFPIYFFVIISIFAFFNVLISINLSISEQKNYYFILTLLGMKQRDLRKMIVLEISIISFISSIISIILGFVISLITIHFTKNLTFSWASFSEFIIVFLLVLLIPIIQSFISSLFIKYKNII